MKKIHTLLLLTVFLLTACQNKEMLDRFRFIEESSPKIDKCDLTEDDIEIIKQTQLDGLPYLFYLSGEDSIAIRSTDLDTLYRDYAEILKRTVFKEKIIIEHIKYHVNGFYGVYIYNKFGLLETAIVGSCVPREYTFSYYRRGDTLFRIDRRFNAKSRTDTTTEISGKKLFILEINKLNKTLIYLDSTLIEENYFYYQNEKLFNKITINQSYASGGSYYSDFDFNYRNNYLNKVKMTSYYFNDQNQIIKLEKYLPMRLMVTKIFEKQISEISSYSTDDSSIKTALIEREKK